MDHEEARRKHTGGKILGFFYWKPRFFFTEKRERSKIFADGVAMSGSYVEYSDHMREQALWYIFAKFASDVPSPFLRRFFLVFSTR